MGVLRKIRCEKKLVDDNEVDDCFYYARDDIHTGRVLRGKRRTTNRRKANNNDCRDDDEGPTVRLPEEYWEDYVVPDFPPDHRDILAEGLFCHIWKTQGKSVALQLLRAYETTNLNKTADDRFCRGCQLWSQEDYERAGWELDRSRRIRDLKTSHQSLVNVRYLTQYKRESEECLVQNPVNQDQEIGEIVNSYANVERVVRHEKPLHNPSFDLRNIFQVDTLSPSPTESSAYWNHDSNDYQLDCIFSNLWQIEDAQDGRFV